MGNNRTRIQLQASCVDCWQTQPSRRLRNRNSGVNREVGTSKGDAHNSLEERLTRRTDCSFGQRCNLHRVIKLALLKQVALFVLLERVHPVFASWNRPQTEPAFGRSHSKPDIGHAGSQNFCIAQSPVATIEQQSAGTEHVDRGERFGGVRKMKQKAIG